jgi:hypothetical protein
MRKLQSHVVVVNLQGTLIADSILVRAEDGHDLHREADDRDYSTMTDGDRTNFPRGRMIEFCARCSKI